MLDTTTAAPGTSGSALDANTIVEAVAAEAGGLLHAMASAVQEGFVLQAIDGTVITSNARARDLLGSCLPQDGRQSPGGVGWPAIRPDRSTVHHPDHPAALALLGKPQRDHVLGVASMSAVRWIRVNAQPISDGGEGVSGVLSTITEAPAPSEQTTAEGQAIAQREIASHALREAEERFRLAFDMAPTGNAIVMPDGRLIRVNSRLALMLGADEMDLLGTTLQDSTRSGDQREVLQMLDSVVSTDLPQKIEVRLSHMTGRPVHACLTASVVHDAAGDAAYLIVQVEDITTRKLAQAALTHQATHDALTALPNRALLLDRLGQALERSRRSGGHVALLFCDIDRFKRINDSLGHEAGDMLLVEVARRLRATIRGADTAGRLGGDEFLVLCEDLANPEDAMLLADRVNTITNEPITVGDQSITVTLSIGVAAADPNDHPAELLRRADTAMYEAKEKGRGQFAVFNEALRDRALRRLQLENELRTAVPLHQLRLWHQPVVDLGNGGIVGREALVRWQHPERGLLAPGAFLDVAEETDLIVELGSWVLDEACKQGRTYIGQDSRHVAINVSARQLSRSDFRAKVEAALLGSGLAPHELVLELTETSLLKVAGSTLADLEALTNQGVRLAVDDFGTGYSSLTYLQRLPVKVVKIDRSFVADITRDRKRWAITKAVISLGDALGLDVVAEGVETAAQAAMLADMGCVLAQGYLFGRPAPLPNSEGGEGGSSPDGRPRRTR